MLLFAAFSNAITAVLADDAEAMRLFQWLTKSVGFSIVVVALNWGDKL